MAPRDVSQDRHAAQRLCDNSVKTRALVPAHAVWCGTIGEMSEIQPIIYPTDEWPRSSWAGKAIISDAHPGPERTTVNAVCLYALEVADWRLPGPCSEARALAYASAAAAKRT